MSIAPRRHSCRRKLQATSRQCRQHRCRLQTHHNIRRHTCPKPRVKRAFPKGLPASPLFTRVSGLPARKRPIDVGLRAVNLDNRASHPKVADSTQQATVEKTSIVFPSQPRPAASFHKATPQKFKSTASATSFRNPYSSPLTGA